MHQSFATIDSPEFINLQPLEINPLMSACEIKVLYVGENRNKSYITKEVATEMSKTLRGAPIVGYYKQEKDDFGDHGERVTIDGDGVKFDCLTTPYGFVAPDAKVWFKKFEETDSFGNPIVREYLMTTGYLWTGQFPECKSAVEGSGKPHSMELDGDTLNGEWSKNLKTGMDFFIINDAIFSKLCILGEDVEPCFEGSSVTAPKISSTFNLDDDFKQTLFSMMQDLKFALEGGQTKMTNLENSLDKYFENANAENEIFTEGNSENSDIASTEFKKEEEEAKKEDEKKAEAPAQEDPKADDKKEDDKKFAKEDDKKEETEEKTDDKKEETSSEEPKDAEKKDEKEDEKKKFSLEDYTALQDKYVELQSKYDELMTSYSALEAFKLDIEDKQKDELIKSFYMLSNEDKQDVIANKAQYSLDEIEAKLSVICVRKKVSFNLDTEQEDKAADAALTFSLNEVTNDSLPAWINAVKNTQSRI